FGSRSIVAAVGTGIPTVGAGVTALPVQVGTGQGRVGRHGGLRIQHRRQNLVIHVNLLGGGGGRLGIVGQHRGHRVSDVVNVAAGDQADAGRQVGAGKDRRHAGQ